MNSKKTQQESHEKVFEEVASETLTDKQNSAHDTKLFNPGDPESPSNVKNVFKSSSPPEDDPNLADQGRLENATNVGSSEPPSNASSALGYKK